MKKIMMTLGEVTLVMSKKTLESKQ